jgi:protein gp37
MKNERSRTTGIEWTQHTWNPTVGCSIATAGCTNCYAMRMAHRIEAFGTAPAYKGLTKSSKGGPVWTGKVGQASRASVRKPLSIATPSVIFVNSMSDLFHPDMQETWQTDAFDVMRAAKRHQYQILTKRPEVAAAYYERHPEVRNLPHVWLGVSVERADVRWRIDKLREIPAAVRFLSVEPLIGPPGELNLDGIHWVITGGESGPDARPCRPEWVRAVRDQCADANVPLFHKQWGSWRNNPFVLERGFDEDEAMQRDLDRDAKGGATLDGRLHREMPAVAGAQVAP